MSSVTAHAGMVGTAKDFAFDALEAVLNDPGDLTPGQKAAEIEKCSDRLNTVLAIIKQDEKAETYNV
jgi:hypothetical protein